MSTALLAVATFFEWETMTTAQLTDRRRSKRVAKAVPILLSGSDIEDKQFSEQTRTLVLSRHGAGIFSTKKLAPQSVLIIRCAETNKEAAVRVIDKVAGTPEGYTYGVAFLDPRIDLWDMEFAPDFQADATTKILECISCQERAPINLNEVELDVYAINKTLSRYCANCGEATSWREVSSETDTKAASRVTKTEPKAEATPALRQENRRKDVRAKVNFSACIRESGSEQIVTCENLSRGGFCFKSAQRYAEESIVEVALPYSVGEPAIFFKAKIVWVLELTGEKLFRCGAAYMKA